MVQLHTELFIDAPPERVWGVLTDFAHYPEWNPFLLRAEGEVREGARVRVRASSPRGPGKTLGFSARVVRVEPARALVWRGGVPGLLHGEHSFQLVPEGAGTRFVHSEVFTGALSLLLPSGLKAKMERAYAGMNEALARRAAAARRGP
jgi:hypothetical protein